MVPHIRNTSFRIMVSEYHKQSAHVTPEMVVLMDKMSWLVGRVVFDMYTGTENTAYNERECKNEQTNERNIEGRNAKVIKWIE